MARRSATVLCAVILTAPAALAQSKKSPDSTTFSSRTANKDGSSSLTFGKLLPTPLDTKLGIDLGLAGSGDVTTDPGKYLEPPNDRGSGAGWASMVVPDVPFGFTKAKVDARFNP